MWKVYRNGKYLGIIETNHAWAKQYWSKRCTDDSKYTLVEVGAAHANP